MTTDPVDVLVIGAGPTGTALALDLRRRGHSVRIIDQAPGTFEGSRAKGVQPRTLEVMEDLGVLDNVLTAGSTYPLLGVHLGPITVPWPMIKTQDPRPGVPYPNTWLIPQFKTNEALHLRLGDFGLTPEFGTQLINLTQSATGVTATVRPALAAGSGPVANAPSTQISARYLIGADGGSSVVRKAVGIGFEGTTNESDRILLFDARTTGLARNRWHVWPGLGSTFIGACPLPGSESFQWMVRIAAQDTPDLSDNALRERISRRTGKGKIQLMDFSWKSTWRPNIRLASSYRAGRVFLAGDAAHVHTPAGAQGLNTGIQDGYNLGWKLSQVLAGADDALLDTYEAERRPIAAAVLGLSTKRYEGLGKLDRQSVTRGDDDQQLRLHYRGGPLAPPSTTTTLHVGDRAPDARLQTLDGRGRRIFEAMAGPHFTLIAFGPTAAAELSDVPWPTVGARLLRLAVSRAADSRRIRASNDDLVDITGEFAKVYGITSDTLLLVRPDGYIGAIATQDRPGTVARQARPFLRGLVGANTSGSRG